ncbi:MAG: TadE/TadG family type IV pilus assembly protein [Eubacteriales bacterium]|nr:TadE/TadG family type IV pilus assembly protein [Eubacteriales bacterium]
MRLKNEEGQAMVEFALVLPVLILILGGIIDFGWIFGNQLLANNACREATRYTAIHYTDSDPAASETAATDIVANFAPLLKNPNVSLTKDGEKVTIDVTSNIEVLTPILSSILGDTYSIATNCTMRLE